MKPKEYNERRIDALDKYLGYQQTHLQSLADAELKKGKSYGTTNQRLFQKNLDLKNLLNDYDKDYKEENELNQKTFKEINDQFQEDSEQIYMESNGYVAHSHYINYRNLTNVELLSLDWYNAAQNVDKAIKWIPSKDREKFIEYNERLYADWEKCIWKKITGYKMWKESPGIVEEYKSRYTASATETPYGTLQGYTVTDQFTRWIECDDIFESRKYENADSDAHEDSTFKMTTGFFLALGNAHETDKIAELKLICYVDGSGEGQGSSSDHGRRTGILTATKVGLQQEKYLKKYDEELETNLKNKQDLEKQYSKDVAKANFDFKEKEFELQMDYRSDVKDIELKFANQRRSKNQEFINSIASTIVAANTAKAKGEDNSQLITKINNAKYQLLEDLETIAKDEDDEIDERNKKLRKEIDDEQKKLTNKLSELSTKFEEDQSVESDRHSEELKKINDEYTEELEQKTKQIEDEYDDAVKAAYDKWEAAGDKAKKAKDSKDEELVDKWNNKFPDSKLEKGYSILDNGVPMESLTDEEKQWVFDSITNPGWVFSVSQFQPSEDAYCARVTAVSEAKKTYDEKMAQLEYFMPSARQKWRIDASSFQSFADEFTDEQKTQYKSAWGSKFVYGLNIIAVYAKLDYKAETGKTYKDYYSIDNPDEDDDNSNNNNKQ